MTPTDPVFVDPHSARGRQLIADAAHEHPTTQGDPPPEETPMNLTDKILQILAVVPLPFVPEAARVASAILAVSHEAHVEAAAAGLPPPTLQEQQDAVAAALPLAQEPWRRVQERAEEELGHMPRPPLHDPGD